MKTAALVVAAGRGDRLGTSLPKAFAALAGKALVVHALEAVARCTEVERVVAVVPPGSIDRFRALRVDVGSSGKLAPPVAGGRERQDSVRAGLDALGGEVELVVVHDAARPLVQPRDVARTLAAARESGAAILAVPVRDTIKRVRDGEVVETPPRAQCWEAQTPQVFRAELLRKALLQAEAEGFVGTDDAELVERVGVRVRVVEGSRANLKVTWPEDLVRAEQLLREALAGRQQS